MNKEKDKHLLDLVLHRMMEEFQKNCLKKTSEMNGTFENNSYIRVEE